MPLTEKTNMLLFCKEVRSSPHGYLLYFTTLETLSTESPRIHRLRVWGRHRFSQFTLGGIYDLKIRGIRVADFEKRDELNLTEELYISLMELRQLRFMNIRAAEKLRARKLPLFHPDQYYSFQETRDIIAYAPSFFIKLGVRIIEALIYIFSVLLPLSLYSLLLYAFIRRALLAPVGDALAETLSVPLVALGALPMMIFLMLVFFSFTDLLLLNLGFSKWYMLKRHVLSSAGVRTNFSLPDREKKRFIRIGAICGALLLISLVLALVFVAVL